MEQGIINIRRKMLNDKNNPKTSNIPAASCATRHQKLVRGWSGTTAPLFALKTCSKCGTEKPIEQFNHRSDFAIRYRSECKKCQYRTQSVRKKRLKKKRPYNKIQRSAYNKVSHAILIREITKPTICNHCGKTASLQGHHEDYSKPLDVVWLCQNCHLLVHWGDKLCI